MRTFQSILGLLAVSLALGLPGPAAIGRLRIDDPAGTLMAFVGRSGIEFMPAEGEPSPWSVRFSLDGPDIDRMEGTGSRIVAQRGTIEEIVESRPQGIEHSFMVSDGPGGPFSMKMNLTLGGVDHVSSAGEDGVAFWSGSRQVMAYAGLKVVDATGRVLRSRMDGNGTRIILDVLEGGVYPILVDPLAKTPSWSAQGNQVGANLGFSVAPAGDVNGDGYDDIIVGVPSYDGNQADYGAAFIYLGSQYGMSISPAWIGEGPAGSKYGYSVSGAGDVNGDGLDDVIVGAPEYTTPAPNPQPIPPVGPVPKRGRAYVYHGAPAAGPGGPWSMTPVAWTLEGNLPQTLLGFSVSTAGDVDGDGYDDVIVGAPGSDTGQAGAGAAYVYLGSSGGLSPIYAWTSDGLKMGARFGAAVSGAGDVDGNGHPDIIVGAPGWDAGTHAGEGAAFIFLSDAAGQMSWTPAWRTEGGEPGAELGFSVASAGDVNGDGLADVIVGAPGYGLPAGTIPPGGIGKGGGLGNLEEGLEDAGAASVFLGAPVMGITPHWSAMGGQFKAKFGSSVSTAGDVNDDGFDDILVGAPAPITTSPVATPGRAYSFLGGPSMSATATWSAVQSSTKDMFGCSVARAGDVNGDGLDDVIVGAPEYNLGHIGEGIICAYHGTNSSPQAPSALAQFRFQSSTPIPPGSITYGPDFTVTAQVSDPDGGLVGLEVEIQEVNSGFGNSMTAASPLVASGSTVSVEIRGLAMGMKYHWQAAAKDSRGAASSWVSFGSNPDVLDEADVFARTNVAPDPPTLNQQEPSTGAIIAKGEKVLDPRGVRFRADGVSDPDLDSMHIEVEARMLGTSFQDKATIVGPLGQAGRSSTATDAPPAGAYHWQARLVDCYGEASAWVRFGGNLEDAADFILQSNGSGGGHGCLQQAAGKDVPGRGIGAALALAGMIAAGLRRGRTLA